MPKYDSFAAMFRLLITAACCTLSLQLFAQIPQTVINGSTEEEYDTKAIHPADKASAGEFHFGDSEAEWSLVVIPYHDSLIVQVWAGQWGKNYYTKKEAWLRTCITYNKVPVNKGQFKLRDYNCLFADLDMEDGKKVPAVLILGDPAQGVGYGKDTAQIGEYSGNLTDFFSGNWPYPELSMAVQPDTWFAGKSKQELRIMRNSILAKYGLFFQAEGEMEAYFKKQEWYNPFLKDVSKCLTTIEDKNIQTMLRLEKAN